MVWRTFRSQAVAALLAATCLAAPALAQAPPPTPTPTQQDAPPPNRLALVIGEAGYVGDPLPTAANDAVLVAKTLGGAGIDVSELHDLNTSDLAADYQGDVANAFRGTKTRFLLASFTSDWLFPTAESRAIARALNRAGANVSFVEISSDKGHDAFLLDEPDFHRTLAGFLAGCAVHAGLEG